MKKTHIALLVVGVALFGISLALPAFRYGSPDARLAVHGWECLIGGLLPAIFGVFGIFQGQNEFLGTVSWFANPLLLLAWGFVVSRNSGAALGFSLSALALSLVFPSTGTIPMPGSQGMDHIRPAVAFYGLGI